MGGSGEVQWGGKGILSGAQQGQKRLSDFDDLPHVLLAPNCALRTESPHCKPAQLKGTEHWTSPLLWASGPSSAGAATVGPKTPSVLTCVCSDMSLY